MYCSECGHHQSDANKYCGHCGALLMAEGQSGDTTGPFSVPKAEIEGRGWPAAAVAGPALAVRTGGTAGEVFPLDRTRVSIGRSPASDIFLDDITVSRNHAVILQRSEGPVLEDLGSLNGTYVNRRRIASPEPLVDGDELQIGKFRLTFLGG
jgi:hypothetical protein